MDDAVDLPRVSRPAMNRLAARTPRLTRCLARLAGVAKGYRLADCAPRAASSGRGSTSTLVSYKRVQLGAKADLSS